jgi:hypothetical protein
MKDSVDFSHLGGIGRHLCESFKSAVQCIRIRLAVLEYELKDA